MVVPGMNFDVLQNLVDRVGRHNAERGALENALKPYIAKVTMNVCIYDHREWGFQGVENGKVRLWHFCPERNTQFVVFMSLEELMGRQS